MTGEDGDGAAAAAGWLAAAARSAGSAAGWVSSQVDFMEILLAVLHGRPRILVPVRQYSYRIRTYYGSVGSPDRYSCT
eukprot:COSAG01_NODE_28670_length_655_cov_38.739209_1_plen_77_part_01